MIQHKLWIGGAVAIVLALSSLASAPIVAQSLAQSQTPEEIAEIRKQAENGEAQAQTHLGSIYYYGRGGAQDYEQAVHWYRKAAAQGYAEAQKNLGDMYYSGRGVALDNEQAVHWWRKAAVQGYAVAQSHLGVMYRYGRGVTQNYRRAYFWSSLATTQKYEEAIEDRDIAIQHLSEQEIKQTQAAIAQCVKSDYKDCHEP